MDGTDVQATDFEINERLELDPMGKESGLCCYTT